MGSYYCIYFLVLGGIFPAGIADGRWRRLLQKVCVPFLLAILLLFAALRSSNVDRDYINYQAWFDRIASDEMTLLEWNKDPGFTIVLKLAVVLGMNYIGATFVLIALALAGMILFAWLISGERFFSVFIYLFFCRFFLAQEMTAIRAGIAIPLLSLSILYMHRGRKTFAIGAFLLSVSFHLAALFALPALLLVMCGVRFKSRWWMGLMVPTVILLRISTRDIKLFFSLSDCACNCFAFCGLFFMEEDKSRRTSFNILLGNWDFYSAFVFI
jgi:hypothetical protein